MEGALRDLFPASLRRTAADIFGASPSAAILLRQPEGAGDQEFLLHHPAVAALLHPSEIARFNEYRYAKRRAEYLTGRLCAKLALALFWTAQGDDRPPVPAEVEIVNGATGRPQVNIAGWTTQPLPQISISHGGEYGAAIAVAVPCGIDIQEHKEALLRVRDRYCTAGEFRLLEESLTAWEPLAALALLWAAKEAAKKTLSFWRMPGFHELELRSPVLPAADCHLLTLTVNRAATDWRMPATVRVVATRLADYSLAICQS
jgi:4'-phosphopantetheinyl transferase EntD